MKEQDRENSFEDMLRQKATGFHLQPSDDVWANVKISLQQDKRKRRFIWLWTAVVGLFIGAGTTSLYFMSHMNSSQSSYIDRMLENDITQSQTETDAQSLVKNNTTDGTLKGEQLAKVITSASETESQQKQVNSSTKPANNASHTTWTAATQHNSNIGKNVITAANNSAEILTTVESGNSTRVQIAALTNGTFLISENNSSLSIILQQIPVNSETGAAFKDSRFSLRAEMVPIISAINYYGKHTDATAAATIDGAFADSISQLSKQNGKPLIGFSTGISLQYAASKRFALGAGIYFTQTGEKNSFLKAGGPESALDTSSITGNGTNNYSGNFSTVGSIESVSRYNWIDLSLNGEWYFIKKQKNELSLFAGAGLSKFMKYTFSANGKASSGIKNTALLNNIQEPLIFHAYNLTSQAGINYQRVISEHFSLVGGMQFHYYLSDIVLSESLVSLHPYWFGINTGFIFRF